MRCLLVVLLATTLPAQTVSLGLRADALGVERRDSPASIAFAWPADLEATAAAADRDRPMPWTARLVETATGRDIACEVLAASALPGHDRRGELRFVVDALAAGETRAFRLELGAGPATPKTPFASADATDTRTLTRDGALLLRHETAFDRAAFEATKKPIWHLFDPTSGVQITKGAGGEFPHHRGLFLGWNKTRVGDQTYDLWHCPTAAQRHIGHMPPTLSPVRAETGAATDWLTPLDEIVARETRTLSFWTQPGDTTLLDVASSIAPTQPIALRGDPQHGGFQLRLADEVAQRKNAHYVYPPSARRESDDVWVDCPWVACSATIEGHPVAVLFMSHPDNPGPVRWSTRDYGRFGAYFETDLEPGKPLALQYRLRIWSLAADATPDPAACARAYADYATPIRVTVIE